MDLPPFCADTSFLEKSEANLYVKNQAFDTAAESIFKDSIFSDEIDFEKRTCHLLKTVSTLSGNTRVSIYYNPYTGHVVDIRYKIAQSRFQHSLVDNSSLLEKCKIMASPIVSSSQTHVLVPMKCVFGDSSSDTFSLKLLIFDLKQDLIPISVFIPFPVLYDLRIKDIICGDKVIALNHGLDQAPLSLNLGIDSAGGCVAYYYHQNKAFIWHNQLDHFILLASHGSPIRGVIMINRRRFIVWTYRSLAVWAYNDPNVNCEQPLYQKAVTAELSSGCGLMRVQYYPQSKRLAYVVSDKPQCMYMCDLRGILR